MNARVLVPALLLAGCTVGPDYVKPESGAPAQWTEHANTKGDVVALQSWWATFQDPVLDKLVAQAIEGNLDVKIAAQRVLAARAARAGAAAGFWPTLGANAETSRQHLGLIKQAKLPPNFPISDTINLDELNFKTSWEIDLFGRTDRLVEAAEADLAALQEQRRGVLVSLLGDVGTTYVSLRAAESRAAVARRNIDAEGEIVAITEERFEHGLGSELAVAQARTQLANLEAIVPLLDADAAQARHALAVLTGRNPGELDAELAEGSATLPHVPVLPPTMPSEVVANRPDIRAAERQFAASNARIGASIAAEYPSFTIAPELDFQTQTLGHLLTGNAFGWALSSNVGETIFDGGRLAAGVDQAKAQAEADRLNYRKTILGAFREVEDSLAALSGEQRRRGALAEALADSSLALKRAQEAYRGGFGSFLDVLDSERSVYTAEDAVAQGDQALAEDTVTLYRALGGGWQGVKAE